MNWQAMPPPAFTRNCRSFSNVGAGPEHNRYPRLPARRQDLRLTAEQTTTKSGAQFLMYHSPKIDKLIFATEDGVKLLAQSNCWCGDG
ncbi:hypothetical protein T12_14166, partial [Trichinella patagoniensis]